MNIRTKSALALLAAAAFGYASATPALAGADCSTGHSSVQSFSSVSSTQTSTQSVKAPSTYTTKKRKKIEK